MSNIEVKSSASGSFWYIKANGTVLEGFKKTGYGAATKRQVEAIADGYRRIASHNNGRV